MRGTLRAVLGGAGLVILAASFVPCGQAGTGEEAERPAAVQSGGFDVDVLVGGRPREEFRARGRRYVEAVEGAEYEVRITNPLADRVAVVLAVDGLNTIDARRDPAWEASKWVIGPYQTITLGGWQMSTTRARRFTFTTERDSYASRLGRSSDPGVITATIYRERRPVSVITPRRFGATDERVEAREAATAEAPAASASRSLRDRESSPRRDDDRAATGIGRSVRHDVRSVEMDLEPQPVAEVAIHYRYRPELLRLGVLPRRYAPERAEPRISERPSDDDRRFSPEP